MIDFISEIIQQYGGRIAGTQNARNAQQWVAKQFAQFSSSVEVESIQASMVAKFESLKVFTVGFLVAVIVGIFSPALAIVLSLLNAVFFVGHFLAYFDWLDNLYPSIEDENVYGVIEPTGEVKQTILVAGHIDSVYEFQWWYKLGENGGKLSFLAGILIVFQPLILLGLSLASFSTIYWVGLIALLVLSPVLAVFFWIHDKTRIVDGAADNLSGVAIAWSVGKYFGKGGAFSLKHTRVMVVSFAAEEPGLKGSREFIKRHHTQLRKENAILLNADTIRLAGEITILKGEMNCFVKYPDGLVSDLQNAFVETSGAAKLAMLPMGASDGVTFHRRGVSAVSVVGISTSKFDPCYHTRLDTVENLEQEGLDRVRDAFIQFIKNTDARHSPAD